MEVVKTRLLRTNESQALATLMGAVLVIFIAQWPRLGRETHFDPSIPLEARMSAALFGILFVLPLVAYVAAAILWVLVRLLRGPVAGLHVRVAVFWALLAVTPLWLAHGFVSGLLGGQRVVDVIGFLVLVAFVAILVGGLRAVSMEREQI